MTQSISAVIVLVVFALFGADPASGDHPDRGGSGGAGERGAGHGVHRLRLLGPTGDEAADLAVEVLLDCNLRIRGLWVGCLPFIAVRVSRGRVVAELDPQGLQCLLAVLNFWRVAIEPQLLAGLEEEASEHAASRGLHLLVTVPPDQASKEDRSAADGL